MKAEHIIDVIFSRNDYKGRATATYGYTVSGSIDGGLELDFDEHTTFDDQELEAALAEVERIAKAEHAKWKNNKRVAVTVKISDAGGNAEEIDELIA